MQKRIKKPTKDLAHIIKELKEAGLQIAATSMKPSEIPYYSSVSRENKGELVVK